MAEMKTFLLKNIPDEVHIEAKILAVKTGITLNDLILKALVEHLSRKRKKE
jgi:predicted HicB family RNase H-like nuclease